MVEVQPKSYQKGTIHDNNNNISNINNRHSNNFINDSNNNNIMTLSMIKIILVSGNGFNFS